VLRDLHKQCKIPVLVDRWQVTLRQLATEAAVGAEDLPLASVLKTLLEKAGLTYTVRHEAIVIVPAKGDKAAAYHKAVQGEHPQEEAAVAALKRLHAGYRYNGYGRVGSLEVRGDKILAILPQLEDLETIKFRGGTDKVHSNPFGSDSDDSEGLAISDAGIANLRRATQLVRLMSPWPRMDDEGLRQVCGLVRLQEVDISGSEVTDDGLRHLARLLDLRRLNLANTKVTDAGLAHLKRMTALRNLCLKGTKVSGRAVMELEHILRGCDISWHVPQLVPVDLDPFAAPGPKSPAAKPAPADDDPFSVPSPKVLPKPKPEEADPFSAPPPKVPTKPNPPEFDPFAR
jgi:hypothetical protein